MFRIESLEREGLLPLSFPVWADAAEALGELDLDGRGYVILCGSDGSYVQVAGTGQRLTIEYRQTIGTIYRHFVLGMAPPDGRAARINTSIGMVEVRRSEVLDLRRALEVCHHFFDDGAVPQAYALRDVTYQFAAQQRSTW